MLSTIIYFPIARLIVWVVSLALVFLFIPTTFNGTRADMRARESYMDAVSSNSSDRLIQVLTTTGIALLVYLFRGFLVSHPKLFIVILAIMLIHNVIQIILESIQGFVCLSATGSLVRSFLACIINLVRALWLLGTELFIALKVLDIALPDILI